jgi:hypothetical protein
VTSETAFDIDPLAGGSWSANVYASEFAGTWEVTGTYDVFEAHAELTVTHAAFDHYEMDVDSPQLAGNGFIGFIRAVDEFGNLVDDHADAFFVSHSGMLLSYTDDTYAVTTDTYVMTNGLATMYLMDYVAELARLIAEGVDGECSTWVLILHDVAYELLIEPEEAEIVAGDTQAYTATAFDQWGNPWDVTAETAFEIDPGANGGWTLNEYSSETSGDWTVTGTYDGISGYADLTVLHNTAVGFWMWPFLAWVQAGDSQEYSAYAEDGWHNIWEVTVDTAFTIDLLAGGTWTANSYTAEHAGYWTVYADWTTFNDQADLDVTHGAAADYWISPGMASISADETQAYTATALDAFGNEWDVTVDTVFEAESGAGGAWAGSSFIPQFAGTWAITGSWAGFSDGATLEVTHGVPMDFEIAPSESSITAGGQQAYTATAFDQWDNQWDVTDETDWDIDGFAGGGWVGGTYTSQFASPEGQPWWVYGDLSGMSDTSRLTVLPGPIDHYALDVDYIQTAGVGFQGTLVAIDALGNLVYTDSTTEVDVTSAGSAVFYTDDNYNVPTTSYTLANGMAQLFVMDTVAELEELMAQDSNMKVGACDVLVEHNTATAMELLPEDADIVAGTSQEYTATACDAFGNFWDVTDDVTYGISPLAGGGWSDNTYVSLFAGDWTVTGDWGLFHEEVDLTVTHAEAVFFGISVWGSAIEAGEGAIYFSIAFDVYTNIWDVTDETTFDIDDAAGGLWLDNEYFSEFAGEWTVTGDWGVYHDGTPLEVVHTDPATFRIEPLSNTITAGETQTYTATAIDIFTNSWDVTDETTFDIDDAAGGSWDGNVYTSQFVGRWTVTGSWFSGILWEADSILDVTPGALHHIEFNGPHSAEIGVGFEMTLMAKDRMGNTIDYDGDVELTYDALGPGGIINFCTDDTYDDGAGSRTYTMTDGVCTIYVVAVITCIEWVLVATIGVVLEPWPLAPA